MNDYLLFDLDGTLTDPKVGITTCVQYALHAQGTEEPNLDVLEPFIGPPLKDSFMQFYRMDEKRAEEAIAKYRERFENQGIFENEIYKGIPQMLKELKKHHAVLAVASSKPTVFVKRILEHFHIAKYFDVVVGSELDGTRTSKEEVIEEALHQLFGKNDIDYDNTVMIGDRKFDVEGAKKHHLVSVGVSYGYGDIEELKEAKADFIARSVDELKELLMRGRMSEHQMEDTNSGAGEKIVKVLLPIVFYYLVSDACRLFLLFLVYSVYSGQGVVLESTPPNVSALINCISFIAAFVFMYKIIGKWELLREKSLQKFFRKPSDGVTGKILTGVSLIFLGIGIAVSMNLLFQFIGLTGSSQSFTEVAGRQLAVNPVIGFVLYGFLSPMAEELTFRGIVFNRLKRYMPTLAGIVLSAFLFGAYHGNVVQAAYGFVVGCILAYSYHISGKFYVTVLLHGVVNITGFFLSYWKSFDNAMFANWYVCIVAFALAIISFLWINYRYKA